MRPAAIALLASGLVALTAGASTASAATIWSTNNGAGVYSSSYGPPEIDRFSVTSNTYMVAIENYHFNVNPLDVPSITIGLFDETNNVSVGSWTTTTFWATYPYTHYEATMGVWLHPNIDYKITDDHASSWSWNPQSGLRGMGQVFSGEAPAVPEPATLALLGVGAIGLAAVRRRRRG